MPFTATGDIVGSARDRGRGVGAFNVIQLESAEAIIAGADSAGLAVLLQISENCARYHGALEPVAAATLAAARAARVPVGVHLDHAETPELVYEAIDLGFTSVMFDAARLDYDDNVRLTREVTEACHANGVWVEAELGEVGGKDRAEALGGGAAPAGSAHAPGVRTDPVQAAAFVAATGVDALAVAVGSSHAMLSRDAALDFDLIARLRDAVPVPLVLHGSSGVGNEALAKAVDAGMTKINVSTHLNKVFTAAVRDYLAADPAVVDTRKYLGAGRQAMAAEVATLLRIIAG
jgi:fructose-bisphosphate aldolase class II